MVFFSDIYFPGNLFILQTLKKKNVFFFLMKLSTKNLCENSKCCRHKFYKIIIVLNLLESSKTAGTNARRSLGGAPTEIPRQFLKINYLTYKFNDYFKVSRGTSVRNTFLLYCPLYIQTEIETVNFTVTSS